MKTSIEQYEGPTPWGVLYRDNKELALKHVWFKTEAEAKSAARRIKRKYNKWTLIVQHKHSAGVT